MLLNKQGLCDNIHGSINCYFNKDGSPKHGEHDYSIYDDYQRFDIKNTGGMIGYQNGVMKIDVEGSGDDEDWRQNRNVKKAVPLFPTANQDVKVMEGFKEAYMNIRDVIIPKVENHVKAGSREIITGGHSHGSAVSLIMYRDIIWHAAHKWKRTVNIACVQVAGPRVYNTAGMHTFRNCVGTIYLLELNNDPVCNVPPKWMDYRHVYDIYIPLRLFPRIPIFELPILRLLSVWNHIPQRYLKAMNKYKGKI